MAIQAGKSITSACPPLVSVLLTGLERILSSLNMDPFLSLPQKVFTYLTAIIAVVVELARHFTATGVFIYSVLAYEEASINFEQEWLKRVVITSSPRIKFVGLSKFISENKRSSGLLAFNFPAS
ncbi:hypothetical protein AVEN_224736-1 [Araneus ventricosus]|uniref:Uncharacterized protein n=1 Tax=Araneus ventricosus TaxID=182803 RepID=A0A4Y2HWB3_ARAVE|nr:hypothetical protein AVEN_224736-1 [Araneus ventricosus]